MTDTSHPVTDPSLDSALLIVWRGNGWTHHRAPVAAGSSARLSEIGRADARALIAAGYAEPTHAIDGTTTNGVALTSAGKMATEVILRREVPTPEHWSDTPVEADITGPWIVVDDAEMQRRWNEGAT